MQGKCAGLPLPGANWLETHKWNKEGAALRSSTSTPLSVSCCLTCIKPYQKEVVRLEPRPPPLKNYKAFPQPQPDSQNSPKKMQANTKHRCRRLSGCGVTGILQKRPSPTDFTSGPNTQIWIPWRFQKETSMCVVYGHFIISYTSNKHCSFWEQQGLEA